MVFVLYIWYLVQQGSGDGVSQCVVEILVCAIAIQIHTYVHYSFWKLGLAIYQGSVLEPEIWHVLYIQFSVITVHPIPALLQNAFAHG